jgi:hypothetical protein
MSYFRFINHTRREYVDYGYVISVRAIQTELEAGLGWDFAKDDVDLAPWHGSDAIEDTEPMSSKFDVTRHWPGRARFPAEPLDESTYFCRNVSTDYHAGPTGGGEPLSALQLQFVAALQKRAASSLPVEYEVAAAIYARIANSTAVQSLGNERDAYTDTANSSGRHPAKKIKIGL